MPNDRKPGTVPNDTKPRRRGDNSKGLIYIGKVIIGLLAALLAVCIITQTACATSPSIDEAKSQITDCQVIKETAHQMAECARKLGFAEEHAIIKCAQEKWQEAFSKEQDLTKQLSELTAKAEPTVLATTWTGSRLTRLGGVNYGPSGKETYYNLNMSGCVNRMRRLGYDATNYPVWTRSDGAKMFGPFIMCAASFSIRPLGTIVESSMGFCIVVDTGSFAYNNPTQLDLCFKW